jgi:hypothetical protein
MRDGSGVPVNVSEVSFQIFEKISTPGTPIQTFPLPAGTRESVDLNACPTGDRVDTGRYVAVYTVPLDALIGTWEIRWFTKLTPGSPEQTFAEEFEVLSSATAGAGDTYISVADVRAEGLNADPPSDATIQTSICVWQQILERCCRQWFRPIATEFLLDGTDSDTLHLSIPIISIDEIRLNDSETVLEEQWYRVYDGNLYPDDRKNPRIKLRGADGYHRDIYTSPNRYQRARFHKGRQNQFIKGTFGYVEPDGSTPEAIKRALMILVLKDVRDPLVPDPASTLTPPSLISGIVQEEWTDGHSIVYQPSGGPLKSRRPGLSGLIDDPAVQRIITLYKGPVGMATPANPTWI